MFFESMSTLRSFFAATAVLILPIVSPIQRWLGGGMGIRRLNLRRRRLARGERRRSRLKGWLPYCGAAHENEYGQNENGQNF
jgi:hypothetical protein